MIWTLIPVGVAAVLLALWWVEVRKTRAHMLNAKRNIDSCVAALEAAYPTPTLQQFRDAARGHVPPRHGTNVNPPPAYDKPPAPPNPPLRDWTEADDRNLLRRAAMADEMDKYWRSPAHQEWQRNVDRLMQRPLLAPRKCRFKRGLKA